MKTLAERIADDMEHERINPLPYDIPSAAELMADLMMVEQIQRMKDWLRIHCKGT